MQRTPKTAKTYHHLLKIYAVLTASATRRYPLPKKRLTH